MSSQRDVLDQAIRRAVTRHVSLDDLARYHDGLVDDAARALFEAHLEICVICSRRYQTMHQTLADQSEPQRRAMPQDLLAQLKALVGSLISPPLRPEPGMAFAARHDVQDGQSEDGSLRWRVKEDESGDVIVRLGSHRLEFMGCTVTIRAGGVRKHITLRPRGDDQVGGQTRIGFRERQQAPDKKGFVIERISCPEGTPPATGE